MQKPSLSCPIVVASALLSLSVLECLGQAVQANSVTRLNQLPAPKIVASSEAYPGGRPDVGNITDGKFQTEYSSNAESADN